MPSHPADEAALEELLSRPTRDVEQAVADLPGDLVLLGAGGKMGPTLARMARRAGDASGWPHEVVAVSRFSDAAARARLEGCGVRTVVADLSSRGDLTRLPDAGSVLFLAGRKFGTSGAAHATWIANAVVPALCAERYAGVPTVAFSSGNVYPLMSAQGPGASEATPPAPAGEYAWSVLARERAFEAAADRDGTPSLLLRLNYAVELRYGVLVDVAQRVRSGAPVDLGTGFFNAIWQGDANALALRALGLVAAPPAVLNVTGCEVLSVRAVATRFGELFARAPRFEGREEPTALLADASACAAAFGPPPTSLDEVIAWTAAWLDAGGVTWDGTTHFEVRDGAY